MCQDKSTIVENKLLKAIRWYLQYYVLQPEGLNTHSTVIFNLILQWDGTKKASGCLQITSIPIYFWWKERLHPQNGPLPPTPSFPDQLAWWQQENKSPHPAGRGGSTILPTSSFWLVSNVGHKPASQSINQINRDDTIPVTWGCSELKQCSLHSFLLNYNARQGAPRSMGSPNYSTVVT